MFFFEWRESIYPEDTGGANWSFLAKNISLCLLWSSTYIVVDNANKFSFTFNDVIELRILSPLVRFNLPFIQNWRIQHPLSLEMNHKSSLRLNLLDWFCNTCFPSIVLFLLKCVLLQRNLQALAALIRSRLAQYHCLSPQMYTLPHTLEDPLFQHTLGYQVLKPIGYQFRSHTWWEWQLDVFSWVWALQNWWSSRNLIYSYLELFFILIHRYS